MITAGSLCSGCTGLEMGVAAWSILTEAQVTA
jgi:predicted Fe-S protein YdhL (DUF1289 family)